MARDVVTYTWCDICLTGVEEEQVEGTEVVMAVGQMKPRLLALCPGHMEEVFVPLRDLLLTMPIAGETPTPGRATQTESTGDFPCLVCGKQYSYKKSLQSHLRSVHNGMSLTTMREKHKQGPGLGDLELKFGEDEKASDDEPPAVTRAECGQPGCDVVYEWPENKRPVQAVAVHRNRAHGIKAPKRDRRRKAALSA